MCLILSELKVLKVFFSHHVSFWMICTVISFFFFSTSSDECCDYESNFQIHFFFLPLTPSFSKLPSWARAVVPKIFYVTEKAWNYYPYTITGKHTIIRCFAGCKTLDVPQCFSAWLCWTQKNGSVVWYLNCYYCYAIILENSFPEISSAELISLLFPVQIVLIRVCKIIYHCIWKQLTQVSPP